MKNRFVLFLICAFPWVINSQVYDLFNDVLSPSSDSVYIHSNFEPFLDPFPDSELDKYLSEHFVRQSWEPITSDNTPDIELFLENMDIIEARTVAIANNSLNKEIEFEKLHSRFIKVVNKSAHLENNLNYIVLSRPIFNNNKDWAIVYYHTAFHTTVGTSGEMRIFRKIDGKWTYYWQITVWIS